MWSCEPDPDPVSYESKYGNGTYILTDNGLNFIKKNTTLVKNQIFSSVNGSSLLNPVEIEIYGNRLYIVGKDFYATDINTLQLLGQVGGFVNASACAIIPQNRAFVSDKSESLVKLVDLDNYRIISEIETGVGTSPGFIINKYDKSFVLNVGDNNNYEAGMSVSQTNDGGFIITGTKNCDLYLVKTDPEGYINSTNIIGQEIK